MTTEQKNETKKGNNGAAHTDPEAPSGLGDEIAAMVQEARRECGYLARNMHMAFDGNLDMYASNAHAALTAITACLTSLDEMGERATTLEEHARHGDAVVLKHVVAGFPAPCDRDAAVVNSVIDLWGKELSDSLDKIEDANNRHRWTDAEAERDAAHVDLENAVEQARSTLSEMRVNAANAIRERARRHVGEAVAASAEVPS